MKRLQGKKSSRTGFRFARTLLIRSRGTVLFFCFTWIILGAARGVNAQDISQKLRTAIELERSGRWTEAKEIYEELYRARSMDSVVFNRLKDLYLLAHEYEKAKAIVEERRQIQPKNPSLDVYLGEIDFKMGKQDAALRRWKDVLDRYPEHVSAYQDVASAMMVERLLDEAVDVYLLGRKRMGTPDLFALQLANLYAAKIEYEKATRELLQYWETYPMQFAYIESQVLQFPKTDRVIREVTEPLREVMVRHPKDLDLRRILVNFFLQAGRYEEGFQATLDLERLTDEKKQGEALFLFGQQALRSGAPKEAERAYEEILESYPHFVSSERVLLGLAQVYEAQERLSEAVILYQNVFDTFPQSPFARQALHRKGLVQRDQLFDFTGAAETFGMLITRFASTREGEEGRLELGRCEIALGNLTGARAIFQAAFDRPRQKEDNVWVRSLVGLADVEFLGGRFDEVDSLLSKLNLKEMDAKTLQDPVVNDGLNLRLFVEEHLKQSPEALRLFSRAEFWERRRNDDHAFLALDSLLLVWPDDALAADALYKRGEIEIRQKRFEDCLTSFQSLRDRFPDHFLADRTVERMGWVYENRGQKKKAIEQYEILLAEYPHSFLVDEARKRIRRLEKEEKR